MLKLDWPAKEPRTTPRPRPLPDPRKESRLALLALAVGAFIVVMGIGAGIGRSTLTDDLTALQQRVDALEVSNAAAKAERDAWETSATVLAHDMRQMESELTSAVAAAEHWRERAEDASATAAAIRDDNTALKAEVARLQQMKREKQEEGAATTVASSGWQTAKVSWYGPGFYGRKTASGAVLTQGMMNVAHRSLAFGTRIEFRYKGRTCVAVVNDRGPFVAGRVFDLGPGTAAALGFSGVGTVEWRVV